MFTGIVPAMVQKLIKRIPYLEALRAFLEQWGLWKYLATGGGLVIAFFYSTWVWLTTNVPLWGIGLIFLAATALILAVFNFAVDAYRKLKAERLDHDAIADDLIRLSEEMSRATNDFIRDRSANRRYDITSVAKTSEEFHLQWEASRQDDVLLTNFIAERFGGRIVAAVIVLRRLEVRIPFHISHLSASTIMSIAAFFGATGQLIKNKNLALAQNFDDRTSWDVAGMLR